MPENTKLCLSKYLKCKHKCSLRFFQRDAHLIVFLFLIGVYEEYPEDNIEEDEENVAPVTFSYVEGDVVKDLDIEAQN